MLEWAFKQEDIRSFRFGFDDDCFKVRSSHTDKRVVEGVGIDIEDAMKNYSHMYSKVMTVKNSFNE